MGAGEIQEAAGTKERQSGAGSSVTSQLPGPVPQFGEEEDFRYRAGFEHLGQSEQHQQRQFKERQFGFERQQRQERRDEAS